MTMTFFWDLDLEISVLLAGWRGPFGSSKLDTRGQWYIGSLGMEFGMMLRACIIFSDSRSDTRFPPLMHFFIILLICSCSFWVGVCVQDDLQGNQMHAHDMSSILGVGG